MIHRAAKEGNHLTIVESAEAFFNVERSLEALIEIAPNDVGLFQLMIDTRIFTRCFLDTAAKFIPAAREELAVIQQLKDLAERRIRFGEEWAFVPVFIKGYKTYWKVQRSPEEIAANDQRGKERKPVEG